MMAPPSAMSLFLALFCQASLLVGSVPTAEPLSVTDVAAGQFANCTADVKNNNNCIKPEYRESSIYQRDSALDVFRRVHFPTEGLDAHENVEFRMALNRLFAQHRPSQHSFFKTLAALPTAVATNGGLLREMYIRYQGGMHATRVAIYFMPGMSTPKQRTKKARIIMDDDSPDIKSHHVQLENLFTELGATNVPGEDEWGEIEDMIQDIVTDENTPRFARMLDRNYRAGLGGWTLFETLSDDWISALAKGFEPHFDRAWLYKRQYFDEIATGHVEIEHMLQSLALTEDFIHRKPTRLQEQIHLAEEMGQEIDMLWDNLENLFTNVSQVARYAEPPITASLQKAVNKLSLTECGNSQSLS